MLKAFPSLSALLVDAAMRLNREPVLQIRLYPDAATTDVLMSQGQHHAQC